MIKIYDTHCHPHLNNNKDQYKVIDDFFQKWWKYINLIWTNKKTINQVIEISAKYQNVFVCIWFHPSDVYDLDLNSSMSFLKEIIKNNKSKVVWIWETWLDYFYFKDDETENEIKEKKEKQKLFFKAQIKLAEELKLPLIIHNREAKNDVLEVLKETKFLNFVFHCFSENLEYAKKLIDLSPNCKISFSWIVTFKNWKQIQKVAEQIDIKHILAETDAPYLTPTPLRGKEENEPFFTKYIIEKIAELKWDNIDEIAEHIYKNSINLFKKKQ